MRTLVSRLLAVIGAIAVGAGLIYALHGSAAADAQPPTRAEVLERARGWLGRSDIPYSMSTCYTVDGSRTGCGQPDVFRADCSGFVSLSWGVGNLTVGSSRPALTPLAGNSSTSHEIDKADLLPGDALAVYERLGSGAHIALFVRWQNEAGGPAVVWEQAGGSAGPRKNVWSADTHAKYRAFRYTGIREDNGGGAGTATETTALPHGAKRVTTFKDAPGRAEPSRDAARVGTLRAGRNYVWCAATGATVTGPEGVNDRWFFVDLDEGAERGWVSAYYAKTGGDNEATADDGTDVPTCPESGNGSKSQAPPPAPSEHGHNHYTYRDASPGGKALAPAIWQASHDDGARVISWRYSDTASSTNNSLFWWGKRHPGEHAYKRLHVEHSGQCIGVRGYQVIQSPCGEGNDGYWAVVDEEGGLGKLMNLATRTCMHVGWSPGDPVVLGSCEGDRSKLAIATVGPVEAKKPAPADEAACAPSVKKYYPGNASVDVRYGEVDINITACPGDDPSTWSVTTQQHTNTMGNQISLDLSTEANNKGRITTTSRTFEVTIIAKNCADLPLAGQKCWTASEWNVDIALTKAGNDVTAEPNMDHPINRSINPVSPSTKLKLFESK
ncbi:hypothetical protein ACFWDI_26355 [Streptomyces sp. NPDC060064]|uniref:hypothetical protein n=1 Tax=Streptomyces sp. NPDC060064 TaxID=3347049 RepID=UPI00367A4C0A